MGTVYYLFCEDNGTAYELGKMPELRHVFGDENRGERFVLQDADTLAELIALVLFEHETRIGDRVLRGFWEDTGENRAYVKWFAADVARWAEGKLVSFESEDSGTIERVSMKAYDAGLHRRVWVTGSRFRDKLALEVN